MLTAPAPLGATAGETISEALDGEYRGGRWWLRVVKGIKAGRFWAGSLVIGLVAVAVSGDIPVPCLSLVPRGKTVATSWPQLSSVSQGL